MPQVTRRSFLKASSAAAVAPLFIPQSAFGANERIVTAHIGVGGRGRGNLGSFKSHAAFLCDVDTDMLAKAQEKRRKDGLSELPTYGDYRELLDRRDIDAVVITTPDHWHALQTIHACEAGKDVYVEKPLTLKIGEGRKMVEAARKYQRVVQTGSQQRSDKRFRQACELVRNGKMKVDQILVGLPKPNHPKDPVPNSEPPASLDYDMWLGPAPKRPYNEKRVHYNFRFFRDYSGGQMTNFGAHDIDIAQWALGMDESGPIEITGTGTFHPQGWHEVTETCRISYKYASGVELLVGQEQPDIPRGITFVGPEGKLFVNRKKIESDIEGLLATEFDEGDTRLYVSNNHHQNFLECIKTRKLPICDVEVGHRSATACHLGNLAIDVGRTIRWDPAREVVVDDAEAQAMTQPDYRAPWEL